MSYECFDVDVRDGVAHLVMCRPEKRNSMNIAFWQELPEIVRDIDQNAKARVIVISSTGPHFTAGIDLAAFGGNTLNPDDGDERTQAIRKGAAFYEHIQYLQAAFSALEQARQPVLAAIQGGCIGGGVDMASACDLRFATEDAYFLVEETNIGMTADVGTLPRLCYLMPEAIVKEMCLLARPMPARRAQQFGLVSDVFADHETMLEAVMAIAAEMAAKAPLAMRGCKQMIHYARDHSVEDALDYIGIWNASMMSTDEIMEAIGARAQKRAGQFVDLPKIKHQR
ncbi:MAG: enoyl-CoA hydratase-related protein [Pseudomonadota bacterium]